MAVDLETLKTIVDELTPPELDELYHHIQARRRAWWLVPEGNIAKLEKHLHAIHAEAATMTDEEIDAAIDKAIVEVRCGQTDRSL